MAIPPESLDDIVGEKYTLVVINKSEVRVTNTRGMSTVTRVDRVLDAMLGIDGQSYLQERREAAEERDKAKDT